LAGENVLLNISTVSSYSEQLKVVEVKGDATSGKHAKKYLQTIVDRVQ
jgi:hypothetical protein